MLSNVPFPGYWAVLNVIFAGANIIVKHGTTETRSFSADFNDVAWNDTASSGDIYYKNSSYSKEFFQMSPRVRVQYNWEYKLVDVYDVKGFKSETLNHDEIYVGPHDAYGYFKYVGAK
jgi:hypothetical protein